jgi:putative DNA primase/helicase
MAKPKDRRSKRRRKDSRRTDIGNAALFEKLHGDTIRYVRTWGKWLVWGDHHWILDHNEVFVTERAKDVSRHLFEQAARIKNPGKRKEIYGRAVQSGSSGKISAMVKLARGLPGIAIDHTQLDRHPWLFAVSNGVVDLRTGDLRNGDPEDLITKSSPVVFNAKAKSPRWGNAMRQWFPDKETRKYVQRLAGAALIGEQLDHLLVIHYGDGGNGKGTFVRAIANVLGSYFVTPHKSLLVAQKHSPHDTERAKLFGVRLAVAVETVHRQSLNEADIKNLTGGDAISGRRMREDPWEFPPSHSLWLQTNYMPAIHGRDNGIWRRIRVVPWNTSFFAKKDPNLDQKLRDEAAGILNRLIEGALKYQESGLNEPAAVIAATDEYRAAEDILGRFAKDIGLVFDKALATRSSELMDSLKHWCEAEGIANAPSAKDIAPWLRSNDATSSRKRIPSEKKQVTVWMGVGFEEDE